LIDSVSKEVERWRINLGIEEEKGSGRELLSIL
jgi:hypothetical protein